MNANVKIYTEEDFASLSDFQRVIPDDEIAYLDAIGDNHDVNRWRVADTARMYIDDWELPAMWVYALISSRTDRSVSTVRQYCAVSRFYHGIGLRELYDLRFSIFKHASKVDDTSKCLQYAQDHRLRRPGELQELFPAKEDDTISEDVRIKSSFFPFWARPFSRKIFEIQDEKQRETAEGLLSSLLDILGVKVSTRA